MTRAAVTIAPKGRGNGIEPVNESKWSGILLPGECLLWQGRPETANWIAALAAFTFIAAMIHPLAALVSLVLLLGLLHIHRDRYALTDSRLLAMRAPLIGARGLCVLERAGTTLMPGYAKTNKFLEFTAPDGRSVRFNAQPEDVRRWFIETYGKAEVVSFPSQDPIKQT